MYQLLGFFVYYKLIQRQILLRCLGWHNLVKQKQLYIRFWLYQYANECCVFFYFAKSVPSSYWWSHITHSVCQFQSHIFMWKPIPYASLALLWISDRLVFYNDCEIIILLGGVWCRYLLCYMFNFKLCYIMFVLLIYLYKVRF